MDLDMDMGGDLDMNDDMDNDMDNDMGGDDELNPEGKPYDSNFDAGVDADEDEDPKKYIQQLTGKLAQSVRDYTKNNEDDSDLNKFVVNSIISATVGTLDSKDKDAVIDKVKNTTSDENEEDETSNDEGDINLDNGDMDLGDDNNSDDDMNLDNDMSKNESKSYVINMKKKHLNIIKENYNLKNIIDEVLNDHLTTQNDDQYIKKVKNPFKPKQFNK